MAGTTGIPEVDRGDAFVYADQPGLSRRTRMVIGVVLVCVAVAASAYGWWRYQKVYLYDDYQSGHTVGQLWVIEGPPDTRLEPCREAADLLYPSSSDAPWGAQGRLGFLAGCLDGLSGATPAGWNLRSRIVQITD